MYELLSIFWRVTVTIMPLQMLMYGREATTRKNRHPIAILSKRDTAFFVVFRKTH